METEKFIPYAGPVWDPSSLWGRRSNGNQSVSARFRIGQSPFLFMGKAIEWKLGVRFPDGVSICPRISLLPLYGEGDRMETGAALWKTMATFHLPLYGEGDRMET